MWIFKSGYVCVRTVSAYMCVCECGCVHEYVCAHLWRPEEVVIAPGAGITGAGNWTLRPWKSTEHFLLSHFSSPQRFLLFSNLRDKHLLKGNSRVNTVSVCLVVVEYGQFKVTRAYYYMIRLLSATEWTSGMK